MPRDVAYLLDILEAAKLAATYVSARTKEEFLRDTQCQDAVIQRLEITGEAARRDRIHAKRRHVCATRLSTLVAVTKAIGLRLTVEAAP